MFCVFKGKRGVVSLLVPVRNEPTIFLGSLIFLLLLFQFIIEKI